MPGWATELGGIRTHPYARLGLLHTELRFALPSGLEVELGVAPPAWAATDPPDSHISGEVASGSLRALYDPEAILARFAEACQKVGPADP